jgi:hypothetical protein
LIALGLLGSGLIARDLARPYRVIEDVQTREFARWLWTERAKDGEIACLKSDFGLSFQPGLWRAGMSAVYLFHQRIFSSRHSGQRNLPLGEPTPSAGRSLYLVSFDHLPQGIREFDLWLARLPGLALRRTESYVIQPAMPGEEWRRDACHVMELAPLRGVPAEVAAGEQTARATRPR